MSADRPKSHPSSQAGRQGTRRRIVAPVNKCRDLVPVDDQPISLKIWRQYQNALKKLEKLVAELRQFKEADLEHYRLWHEGAFSREIVQLQKAQAAVIELTQWLNQIHSYASLCDISTARSFQVLTDAKAEGRLKELWEDLTREKREKETRAQDRRDERESESFKDMFEEMFDDAAEEFHQERRGHGQTSETRAPRGTDESAERSLKALYHQLALKLHPDTNPNQSQDQKQLFQAVQEAYRERDVEALEEIWKKVEGKSEGPFAWKTAPVSDIISRKRALDLRNRDVNTELKMARQHPAWNFSKASRDKIFMNSLIKKIRGALRREQDEADSDWVELNELLSQLEKSSKKKTHNTKSKVKRKV
ncbi:MAG TPA: J domain-containing protein [Oligoflexus sp.]|uniref:J domain-containing protein n=1 Tax=Oligoflexus sp. TaxID=1971216 RepID=UPI002D35C90E|nr:J domain-containing protein [Oligoflexus sp.]HYX36731.1 J domain-containing protein [Oligoflexus sp.]